MFAIEMGSRSSSLGMGIVFTLFSDFYLNALLGSQISIKMIWQVRN